MQQAGEQLRKNHPKHLPWVQRIEKEETAQLQHLARIRKWGSAPQVLTSKKRHQMHSCKSNGVKLGLHPWGIQADLSPTSQGTRARWPVTN